MKLRQCLALALSALLVAALPGCSLAGMSANTAASTDITDMAGREVRLPVWPAERIVVLSPADCEILYALGAGETVVGRGEYCDYPAEAQQAPVVQSGQDTNTEQIIALEPQVVVLSDMAQTDEQIAAIESAGIPVVVTDAQDIEGVYEASGLLGTVVNRGEEAAALEKEMRDRFAALDGSAAAGKSVYFEISPLEYGLWTAGTGTFMNEIADMLGLRNAFGDVSSWAGISQEQVIERSPDMIVTVTMYFGEGPTPVDEIRGRSGWEGIAAVADGAVYQVDNDAFTRPGPRLAEAAEVLADLIARSE